MINTTKIRQPRRSILKREFEVWAREELSYLPGPYLRDCTDVWPDRTYQKADVEECFRAFISGRMQGERHSFKLAKPKIIGRGI